MAFVYLAVFELMYVPTPSLFGAMIRAGLKHKARFFEEPVEILSL